MEILNEVNTKNKNIKSKNILYSICCKPSLPPISYSKINNINALVCSLTFPNSSCFSNLFRPKTIVLVIVLYAKNINKNNKF